jgi:hypothetical protein
MISLYASKVMNCIDCGLCSVTGVGSSGSESYNSQFVHSVEASS